MRFIEASFPLRENDALAGYEISFKMLPSEVTDSLRAITGVKIATADPLTIKKINSLFYYPARMPTSTTRIVSLAALASKDTSKDDLLRACGMDELKKIAMEKMRFPTLFMINPRRDLVEKILDRKPSEYIVIDPMAGGGSIPLEAKRLGFNIIAGDYNPIAFLLLRATIEFPAKYGMMLYELVNEEAKKLIEYVRKELDKYYFSEKKGDHIFVITGNHDCGATIPLIKETALNKQKGIYISWRIDKNKKRLWFRVSNTPPTQLKTCPFCDKPFNVDLLRRQWAEKHIKILERLLRGDESAAEDVSEHYQLVVISITPSRYREPTMQDKKLLVEAAKDLARAARNENIAEYIPMHPIPADNGVFGVMRRYGIQYWHQLFTPRQLLVLYRVVKYLRERSEILKREHGELGVAVALYLALGFGKAVNYNSVLTSWHANRGVIMDMISSYYALGGEAGLGYDFVEGRPSFGFRWAFEPEAEGLIEKTHSYFDYLDPTSGGILPILKILCGSLGGMWGDKDAIYLWDARELDKHIPPSFADLINVDPPYYDQQDYGGVGEFFWVWMRNILMPVLDDLFPKERIKIKWDHYSPTIPRDIEMQGEPPSQPGGISSFGSDFAAFLKACSKVLKPDGLLVVWYAYGKLAGWEELFYRFYEAGYVITKTWQVGVQSLQRRVALHQINFLATVMIIIARHIKRHHISSTNDPVFVEEISKRASETFRIMIDAYGSDRISEALIMALASGMAGSTLFEAASNSIYISSRALLNSSLKIAIDTILRDLMAIDHDKPLELDPVSKLYTILLLTSHRDKNGLLRVSRDFADKISQIVGGSLYMVMDRKRKETNVLLSPRDMARGNYTVSKALRQIYEKNMLENNVHTKLARAISTYAHEKLS